VDTKNDEELPYVKTFAGYSEFAEITDLGEKAQNSMNHPWLYYVLGISGESGELCEKIKKHFRDYDGIMSEDYRLLILKEIGDILWYCDRLSKKLDSSLEEVVNMNIRKLMKRLMENKIHGDGDQREERS